MASIEIRFYSQKPHTDKTETVKGVKGKHRKEDVVFYKYVGVGNVKNKTMSDVEKNIPYSADYGVAQAIRDNDLKKKRKK